MANPMQTPAAIVPEWYLLSFYAVLRSIPNKFLGVVAMFSAILAILLLPITDLGKSKGLQFKNLGKIIIVVFVANFLELMILGAKHVEYPYIQLGLIATALYFVYYGFIVPVISQLETIFANLIESISINYKGIFWLFGNSFGVVRYFSSTNNLDKPCPRYRPIAPATNVFNDHMGAKDKALRTSTLKFANGSISGLPRPEINRTTEINNNFYDSTRVSMRDHKWSAHQIPGNCNYPGVEKTITKSGAETVSPKGAWKYFRNQLDKESYSQSLLNEHESATNSNVRTNTQPGLNHHPNITTNLDSNNVNRKMLSINGREMPMWSNTERTCVGAHSDPNAHIQKPSERKIQLCSNWAGPTRPYKDVPFTRLDDLPKWDKNDRNNFMNQYGAEGPDGLSRYDSSSRIESLAERPEIFYSFDNHIQNTAQIPGVYSSVEYVQNVTQISEVYSSGQGQNMAEIAGQCLELLPNIINIISGGG